VSPFVSDLMCRSTAKSATDQRARGDAFECEDEKWNKWMRLPNTVIGKYPGSRYAAQIAMEGGPLRDLFTDAPC
jgi:hypothetical protein